MMRLREVWVEDSFSILNGNTAFQILEGDIPEAAEECIPTVCHGSKLLENGKYYIFVFINRSILDSSCVFTNFIIQIVIFKEIC